MWIWIVLIAVLGAGLICALIQTGKKEEEDKVENEAEKGIKRAFLIYADFLFALWSKVWPDWYKVDDYFWGGDTADNLRLIHPTRKRRELFEKHKKKTVCNALMVMCAFCFLGFTVCVSDVFSGVIEDNRIKRSDYGQGEKSVAMVAEIGDTKEDFNMVVREKEYSSSEMEKIMEEEFASLKETFTGGKEGDISSDVKMPNSCHDGIVDVSWRFSDYEVIDGEGHFHSEKLKEQLEKSGEKKYPFEVTAVLEYRDMKRTQDWSFNLVMPKAGREEQLISDISDALKNSEENSINEDYYTLPDQVAGVDISWKDKPKGSHMGLLFLGLGAVAAVFVSMKREVKEGVQKRNDEMTLDYPEFVSKLTLMISAGISLVNAWGRVVDNYLASLEAGGGKHYVYEEMLITLREMQNGKPEGTAIEDFGDRCRIPCYKRFATLVTQSMKKGLAGLTDSLNAEVRQSFEIRKSNAKVLGEQATTKLLLPMGIMMGIVLVIVMAPAFMSLSL
ncbi:MAG: type II secretion system F family protein [Lachnospiraceae bacterium]|nr:type II secretion system F family protein [Lachnospiraceae bacterium]